MRFVGQAAGLPLHEEKTGWVEKLSYEASKGKLKTCPTKKWQAGGLPHGYR